MRVPAIRVRTFNRLPLFLLALYAASPSAIAYAQSTTEIRTLLRDPKVVSAVEMIKRIEPETIEEQIRISEIPAPTFHEQKRGEYFKTRFAELGLENVRVSSVGNVIGERRGMGGSDVPTLVLSAHLDTVFALETPLETKRTGTTIRLPGISDDGRGLALLIAIARALGASNIKTQGDIIFVANVGEEGLGDLRGTRHLFEQDLKGRITHFISIDGAGLGVTTGAVGSKRFRVTYSGPGGHSYGAFGMANPIHALGRLIAKISEFRTPASPKTTFSVGVIKGGTSVNSIAASASFDVDFRSKDPSNLASLVDKFRTAAKNALDEENKRWNGKGRLTLDIRKIGDRPAGSQSSSLPLIRLAASANAYLNVEDDFGFSSTDSNVPISIGIPAITIDGGGKARGTHSLNEQWDSKGSVVGSQRALLITLGVVGVQDSRSSRDADR